MSHPENFDELGLAAPVLEAVRSVGYENPSPIQAQAIGPLLAGHDIVGQAQTGTGKTAAFALPLLSRLDLSQAVPQVLVLAPTRELAIQVAEAFQTYARHLPGFHVLPVYGGQAIGLQLQRLRRGVHVVVGTPGRVMDHIERKTLKLDALQTLVLDEADEMLRMGFLDDVEWILEHTPPQRQVALFSATMPPEIRRVAKRHLQEPVEIQVASKTSTVATTSQYYWKVEHTNKLDALTRMLEVEDFDGMLVFVRTKNATTELSEKLEARGYSCAPLSGDIPQKLREKTVDRLKKGNIDIVVATDVAARGLDVDRISHVVNYDIPYDTEAYVHRIGRTGRAGREGKAILFVQPRERGMLLSIERATRQKIEKMHLPTRRDVAVHRAGQFLEKIGETLEGTDLDFYRELLAGYHEDHGTSYEDLAAALAHLAQADRPLQPPAEEERPAAREKAGSFDRYRLEVGFTHGVQPGNIVGAIANEVGLGSEHIGRIKVHQHFSLIELPTGMSREVFQQLRRLRVCGHPLEISPDDGRPTKPRKKKFQKGKKGKRRF